MTTVSLVHSGNKDLEEIQQIVTSTKTANLAQQAIGVTTDFAIMAKKKQLERVQKLKLGKEYFNYGKKGHYSKDCRSPTSNKRKPKESSKKAKRI